MRGSNAKVSATLRAAVNRLTEDGIDLPAFRTNTLGHGLKEPWANPALRQNLLRLKRLYERKLGDFTDFTQIQSAFLSFINDAASNDWLLGVTGNLARPGIQHLIVDEYQDTNPMQEEIYHTIAVRSGAHLTVVGDDDQSMYDSVEQPPTPCWLLMSGAGERACYAIHCQVGRKPSQSSGHR